MSRFRENDYDDENAVLDYGRWQRNAKAVLKSKRGRKALATIREALMALPEHKLIESAFCTVGGADVRLPEPDADEIEETKAQLARCGWTPDEIPQVLERERKDRSRDRADLAELITQHGGGGVCVNGALVWWQKVKAGMDPDEAFASLPTLWEGDPDGHGEPMHETALLGRDAGLVYTLAYELAYRNDETYRAMTPEDRWMAFVAWIDEELASA